VALRWLFSREGLVVPIVGARTAAQLKESLASTEQSIDAKYLQRLVRDQHN